MYLIIGIATFSYNASKINFLEEKKMKQIIAVVLISLFLGIISCSPVKQSPPFKQSISIEPKKKEFSYTFQIPPLSTYIENMVKKGQYFDSYILWDQGGLVEVKGNEVLITFFDGKKVSFDGKKIEHESVIGFIDLVQQQITLDDDDVIYIVPAKSMYTFESNYFSLDLAWTIFVTSDINEAKIATEKYGAILIFPVSS